MAEAIGLAESIIGLIELTGKLVSLGYEYIGGGKDAPKDLRQLVDELHSLSKVLLILQDYARDNRTLQSTDLQILNGQNGPLPGCALELTRLQLKLEPSQGVRGKIKAFVWPLKERETYKHIEQIERHKSLFSLALVVDQLALSRSINEYVRGTSYIVRIIEGESLAQAAHRQNEEAQKTAENRRQVLNWLYPENFDNKHTEISGRRQENTTNWVFETPEFKNWVKDQPDFRMLWGYGIPGAGKTFISSSVIDYLTSQQPTTNYGIAYIYFDYIERDQKPTRILASLVKQLLRQTSCVPEEIQKLYEAQKSPLFEELCIALVIVSGLFGRVFIIFDALDECDQENQRKDLLPLFHRLDGYGISMFLTSRPYPEDIQNSFEDVTKIKISAQAEDIRVYIQQKIDENPRARRLVGQGECEDTIVSGLVDCAKGMFILVRFHIDHICQQTTVRQILSKLESLKNLSSEERPLDPTYDRAMDIIHKQPKDCTELALRTLLWLVKARRALTVDELREAVSIEPNQRSFNDLPDRKTLLDICASLVTIDENSNKIGLAHYTIQEYLLRNRIHDEFGSRLALGCITFLSFDIFAQYDLYENLLLLHPFVRYAVQYLSSHLKDCDESLSVEVLLKLLKNRDNFWSYKKLFDYVVEKDQWYSYSITLYSRLPLHIASALGHRALVYRLLNEDPSIISAPGKYKLTALHEAVLGGNEQVVQLLLEKGAKASPSDIRGKTPLHYAARSGNEVVAHLLLGGAADISSFDEQRRTALHEATKKGHRPMVQLLLENGADISASALYYAIRKRDCLMVQLLLERGADIEASDRGGNTALHLAVKNGDRSVVELLLEKDADIEASGGGGCTALHLAALERDHSLVELLLEKGADIEASEKGGYTALHIAAQKGDRSLVKLLLEKGADTEASNYKGRNGLHFAVLQGDRSLVELLLEKGADIEASDRKGRNALLLAAQNQDRSLVKLLLEKGADTGASDGEGSTVLHLAAWQRDRSLVKLLLEEGADIEASEKGGYTALHIAAQKRDRSLVKLLLGKGADTEASDHKGRNALHFAALQGDRSLVELLLEKGADIEASDHKGKNALHLAARIRDRSLVELLLENGADIEAPDHKRGNALHVAARKGNLLVVQLLLNRDADISLSDISGWTALHLAAYMGHNLVVSLLLDWGSDTASLNNSGQTALQVAVIQRHNAVIQLLSSEDCGDAAPLAPESPAAGGRTKRPAKDIEVSDSIEAPTLSTKRARPN